MRLNPIWPGQRDARDYSSRGQQLKKVGMLTEAAAQMRDVPPSGKWTAALNATQRWNKCCSCDSLRFDLNVSLWHIKDPYEKILMMKVCVLTSILSR